MSIEVMSLVWSRKLGSPSRKAVLLAMADVASSDGSGVWRSYDSLADMADLSRSSVKRAISDLEEAGLIVRDGERRIQGGSVVIWKLDLGAISGLEKPGVNLDPGVTVNATRGHSDPQPGVTVTHNPSLEPSNKPSIDVGLIVDQVWDASPSTARKRSSKKLVKSQVEKALKTITGPELVRAWNAFLSSPDAQKDGAKFVPAIDRWIRDQKYEAWIPREPDLLEQASGPTADELAAQNLDRCFEAFAQFGTWEGMRFGWTLRPTHENAKYPRELYIKHGVTMPAGVQS